MKKIFRCAALLVSLLLLLPLAANAAERIDTSRDVSLGISYRDGTVPLVGAQFQLYLVADADETGKLTATETFGQFNVNITGKDDEAWKELAATLQGYVLRDNIAPTDSGETDSSGNLTFPTGDERLPQGLYLVLGQRHTQGSRRYDAAPFTVMLPTQDMEKNEWLYDVTVTPKYDFKIISDDPETVTRRVLKVWDDNGSADTRPEEITVRLLRNGKAYSTVTLNGANNWRHTWYELDDDYTWTAVEDECEGYTVSVKREGITFVITNSAVTDVPNTDPTPPDKLIQTGQLWWPVPLLTVSGLVLIAIGLLRRRRSDDEN